MAGAESRTQILKSLLADTDARLQPIITYINGDTSWLISFPRPVAEQSAGGKVYYHVAVDPWFGQPAIFGSSFILEMKLGREAGLPSRAAVDTAIVEIEDAVGNTITPTDAAPAVDAICVMGIAGDHLHQPSLLQFAQVTPVIAAPAAAKTIASWQHFNTVGQLPSCDPSKSSWKDAHSGASIPPWLTIFMPTVSRINNFGLALITSAKPLEHQLLLLAPHGIGSDESSIQGLAAKAEPPVKMLALLGPMKTGYVFGAQSTLGVKDALTIMHAAACPYYVRSGDVVSLKYRGLISYGIRDEERDLDWGINEAQKVLQPGETLKRPKLVEVENGASFLVA